MYKLVLNCKSTVVAICDYLQAMFVQMKMFIDACLFKVCIVFCHLSPLAKARRGWSEAERTAVHKHLDAFIKQRQVPGKEACMKCINKEKVLGKRTWKDVKNLVYNRVVTLNRRSASRNLKF